MQNSSVFLPSYVLVPLLPKGHHSPVIGIDWVSLLILVAAYAFAQVRTVPAALRYGVFAGAAALIALYKLQGGAAGANLILIAVAAVLAVWYAVKAVQALGSRRPPRS